MIGFQSTTVEYERGERFAGESKYPLGKMITFAFEGITSLSVKPIRMITIGGLLICLISLGMLIKSFVDYFNGNVVPRLGKYYGIYLGAWRSADICDRYHR